jgi:hypothetical protein
VSFSCDEDEAFCVRVTLQSGQAGTARRNSRLMVCRCKPGNPIGFHFDFTQGEAGFKLQGKIAELSLLDQYGFETLGGIVPLSRCAVKADRHDVDRTAEIIVLTLEQRAVRLSRRLFPPHGSLAC